MILLLQRVLRAEVRVANAVVGRIEQGLLAFVGVADRDTERDADWCARKTVELRCFADDAGNLNRSLLQVGGAVLAVSQFTLLGDCRKGRRPSFHRAAPPGRARELYERYVDQVRARGIRVETGRFQAMMEVELVNAGPVTLILESPAP